MEQVNSYSCILWLSTMLFAACHAFAVDYITLKGSDVDPASSFITNNLAPNCGWSNDLAPQPELDYYVGKGLKLFSPYDMTVPGTETYVFPGRSLTLDGGMLVTRSQKGRVVQVDDLVVRTGTFSNNGNSLECALSGKVTIETALAFSGGTGSDMNISAEIVAPPTATVTFSSESKDAGAEARWRTKASRRYRFCGDCSQNQALNTINWNGEVSLDCPDFAGTLAVDNIGLLKVSRTGVSVSGAVRGRDGWLQVPTGASFSVRALNFAFAEPASYIANGINCYSMQPDDGRVPYEVRTVKVKSGDFYRNAIALGNDVVMTVGDATLDGTLLDISANAVMNITNSLTVTNTPVIRISSEMGESDLVMLPVGKSALNPADFRLEISDADDVGQYGLVVVVEDGLQKLRLKRYGGYATYNASTGFVVQQSDDSNSKQTFTNASFSQGANWSDHQPPHADTNYFTNGKLFRIYSGHKDPFVGKALVQKGSFRVSAQTVTIDDYRVVNKGAACSTDATRIYTSGDRGTMTLAGTSFRVMTTESGAYTFEDNCSVLNENAQKYSDIMRYVVDFAKFYGGPASALACYSVSSPDRSLRTDYGRVEFRGDMSEYRGLIWVGSNNWVSVQTALPEGRVRLTGFSSVFSTDGANGATIALAQLKTVDCGEIDAALTNTLVVGALDVTGTLTKNGAGVLAVSGVPAVGTGAELFVKEGGLKPLSTTAVAGLPVRFANGAKIVLDWEPADVGVAVKGLDLSQSSLSVEGELAVVFDVKGEMPAKQTVEKALFTVADSDVSKIAGKFSARMRGFTTKLKTVSSGGCTTYFATFAPSGFMLIFR